MVSEVARDPRGVGIVLACPPDLVRAQRSRSEPVDPRAQIRRADTIRVFGGAAGVQDLHAHLGLGSLDRDRHRLVLQVSPPASSTGASSSRRPSRFGEIRPVRIIPISPRPGRGRRREGTRPGRSRVSSLVCMAPITARFLRRGEPIWRGKAVPDTTTAAGVRYPSSQPTSTTSETALQWSLVLHRTVYINTLTLFDGSLYDALATWRTGHAPAHSRGSIVMAIVAADDYRSRSLRGRSRSVGRFGKGKSAKP